MLWLLRGGALVASMVSSLPAWHLIDPLPILRNATGNGDDDSGDDDEVESVFGGGRPEPDPEPELQPPGSDAGVERAPSPPPEPHR